MIDLKAKEFKNKLIDEANNSGLPVTMLYYIFADITEMARASMEQQIEIQLKQKEVGVENSETK